MADKQSTKPARGTRDFLPDDIRRREHVIGVVREVYQRYGFEPLETPAFENIETLMGKYGEEGNQLIFKILKRGEHERSGEADLALRYDLTVPLARVVAEHQTQLPTLFKRYQIQPVWRADRPARGRFREFYQCDIDATGSTSPIVEAEILGAVSEILTTLGFADFVIRLNHRGLLAAVLAAFGMPGDALVALDKLDKIGVDGVIADLVARGVPQDRADPFVHFFGSEISGVDAAGGILSASENNEFWLQRLAAVGAAGSDALRNIEQVLALTQVTEARGLVRVDPSLARGLSYYTGAIMEIAVDGIGSLGGGGRYDNLVGMFLGRDVPACGFSLGLERIIVVMSERGMFPESVVKNAVDIVVTFLGEGSRVEALKLAGELRQARWRVDVFPDAGRKFDKPLKYAAARGARVMAIFGENEAERGEASIRNLETREQVSVPRADAASYVASLLNPQ
ncbi:MAG: hisS [Acidobacteria bacterium]|nr:hisS [Acidobacteriota bacterium]